MNCITLYIRTSANLIQFSMIYDLSRARARKKKASSNAIAYSYSTFNRFICLKFRNVTVRFAGPRLEPNKYCIFEPKTTTKATASSFDKLTALVISSSHQPEIKFNRRTNKTLDSRFRFSLKWWQRALKGEFPAA